MHPDQTRELLERVHRGELSVEEALLQLRGLPYRDLDFARVDTHRELRCGYPEVIYCEGKTPLQVGAIAEALAASAKSLLATRASQEAHEAIRAHLPHAEYHASARCVTARAPDEPLERVGRVVIACAGTSDLPVAEEAQVTAEIFGSRTELLADVGVAGIHRLFASLDRIQEARALVVVAGMEGALASVIGGLVRVPVFAVPTSVGYGTSLGGLAPLLTMLNSCSPGVSVVNIDNGFGAGYLANLVNRSTPPAADEGSEETSGS